MTVLTYNWRYRTHDDQAHLLRAEHGERVALCGATVKSAAFWMGDQNDEQREWLLSIGRCRGCLIVLGDHHE